MMPRSPAPPRRPGDRRHRGAPSVWTALLAALMVASCRHPVADVAPPVSLPDAFRAEGEALMPERWWTAFGDETLNRLVEEALRGNFTLRVAWDRLDQARAAAIAGGADLWPSVDATAGAAREVERRTTTGRTYTKDFSLGLAVSYEVDLWGRIRSTADAARLDASATGEDLHAAAVTLAAEVVRTWYDLVEQRGQLALLDDQIATDETYLDIITLKFRRGQVSATDVLQQQQLVELTRGDQVLVRSSVSVLENQLAVLLGRVPGGLVEEPPLHLPDLPPLPRAGVPASLVRRRPDVRAAELRIQASDQRVAAAVADQWPALSLTAGATTTANEIRDLFDNWLASLAANLAAPLFDAGRRRAEVERTRAVLSERLNTYGDAVLTALAEVDNGLVQEARQADYVASLARQLDLSQKATDQTLENYTKGTTEFTRYLTTLLAHQRLQRSSLTARRDLVRLRIELYRALAGGWALPRPARARIETPQAARGSSPEGRDDEPARPTTPDTRSPK